MSVMHLVILVLICWVVLHFHYSCEKLTVVCCFCHVGESVTASTITVELNRRKNNRINIMLETKSKKSESFFSATIIIIRNPEREDDSKQCNAIQR